MVMERQLVCFTFCMSLLALCSCLKGKTEINWMDSFQQGLQLAQREEKIMMVDFRTDWCEWCKALDTTTYTDTRVVKFSSNLICVKVDAEKDVLISRKYKIYGFPSILFIRGNGNEIDRIVGYYSADEFLKAAKDILAGKNIFTALLEKEKKYPNDVNLLYRLGVKFQDRGMGGEAIVRFKKIIELDPKNESGKSDSAIVCIGEQYVREKERLGEMCYYMAINEFNRLIFMYPKSKCVENAKLYIGYCFEKVADTSNAIAAYKRFISDYPQTKSCDWAKERIEKLASKGAK